MKELWDNSCGRFADISEKVDDLLTRKRYVEQVLGMLQGFLDLEANVEALSKKLSDEDEVFTVYKQIKVMNYMRASFLSKVGEARLARIKEHFRPARELEARFHEQVIQGNLQNVHVLAKKNPSLLVKVLRVIENDEVASKALDAKFLQKEEEEKRKQTLEQLARESHPFKGVDKRKRKDSEEASGTLKEKALQLLRMVVRRRAGEFFEAEVDVD